MRTRNSIKEELVKQKAIEMLVQQGIEGFGMNRLAKECGISVATLYIYYADKDDLIKKIGAEIGQQFFSDMLQGFSPEMPFVEGLRKQWENRSYFVIHQAQKMACWEVLQNSSYHEYIVGESMKDFKDVMRIFLSNAIAKKEVVKVSHEVFWAMAYGSLYTLLRFHERGKSISGTPFQLTPAIQKETFELVIRALTPDV